MYKHFRQTICLRHPVFVLLLKSRPTTPLHYSHINHTHTRTHRPNYMPEINRKNIGNNLSCFVFVALMRPLPKANGKNKE